MVRRGAVVVAVALVASLGMWGGSAQAVSPSPCLPKVARDETRVAATISQHFYKIMHHLSDLVKNNPKLAAGVTRTWESVKFGVDRKFTMTLQADGKTYSFMLNVAPTGGPFVTAETATLSSTTVGAVTQTMSVLTLDDSTLQSVVPSTKSSGQVAVAATFVNDTSRPAGQQTKKTATFTLTNFLPTGGDPHGPRNGSFTWEDEPGIGGYFQVNDSLLFPSPCPPNPTGAVVSLATVARWYTASDGSVHGRSDAKAAGGQIATGDQKVAVICTNSPATNPSHPSSSYWMEKLEDGTGTTVTTASKTTPPTLTGAPCDSGFGAIPKTTDNSTDYDFTQPVTFPGQW